MVPHHSLIAIASNRWAWLRRCWSLRLSVLDACNALNKLPDAAELYALKTDNSKLKAQLLDANVAVESAKKDKAAAEASAAKSAEDHALELAAAKSKSPDQEIQKLRDILHLVKIERNEFRRKLEEHEAEHKLARDGNRMLLNFIHKRHRLNVKFDPASIRGAMRRAEQESLK